jgi:hypothetical protein
MAGLGACWWPISAAACYRQTSGANKTAPSLAVTCVGLGQDELVDHRSSADARTKADGGAGLVGDSRTDNRRRACAVAGSWASIGAVRARSQLARVSR